MNNKAVITQALSEHLFKVRSLVSVATEDYNFNVKCVNSNLGYYELIALDTSSYDGNTLTRAAIDIVEIPSSGERETLLASINAYYQLVQDKLSESGKIGKREMEEILHNLYSSERMAA